MPKKAKAGPVRNKKVAPSKKKNQGISGYTSAFSFQNLKVGLKQNSKTRNISLAVLILALLILILPHLAIAMVDGRPITVFDYYKSLDSKYGKDTREQLISERLVENEAQKRGVTVSPDEINNQFNQMENQASGSANLAQILSAQGMTTDDFKKQIRLQTLVRKMFEKEASVSAQEVDNYIAQNKDQMGAINDQTRQTVTNQLKQQKTVAAFQAWLNTALVGNRVVRL